MIMDINKIVETGYKVGIGDYSEKIIGMVEQGEDVKVVEVEKNDKILIAVLNMGWVQTKLVNFLLWMCGSFPEYEFMMSTVTPVDANRNSIIEYFISEKRYKGLLMIDDDTVPTPEIIGMLESGKDIITGVYCSIKPRGIEPEVLELSSNGLAKDKDCSELQGIIEVDYLPGGCLYISRKAAEEIPKPLFKFLYNEKGLMTLSEDYYFAQTARKAGYKMYCDTRVLCQHIKDINICRFSKGMQMLYDNNFARKDMELIGKENK